MFSEQFVSQVRLKTDAIPDFERYPFCLPAVRFI